MRKESIIVFGLSLLISAGIIGALSYFHYKTSLDQKSPPPAVDATADSNQPLALTGANRPNAIVRQRVRRAPVSQLLKTAQKCIGANGNVIYTNQPNCANAKPKGTLSIVEFVPPPKQNTQRSSKKSRSSNRSAASRKTMKPLPANMKIPCKFPIGKARRIETNH